MHCDAIVLAVASARFVVAPVAVVVCAVAKGFKVSFARFERHVASFHSPVGATPMPPLGTALSDRCSGEGPIWRQEIALRRPPLCEVNDCFASAYPSFGRVLVCGRTIRASARPCPPVAISKPGAEAKTSPMPCAPCGSRRRPAGRRGRRPGDFHRWNTRSMFRLCRQAPCNARHRSAFRFHHGKYSQQESGRGEYRFRSKTLAMSMSMSSTRHRRCNRNRRWRQTLWP